MRFLILLSIIMAASKVGAEGPPTFGQFLNKRMEEREEAEERNRKSNLYFSIQVSTTCPGWCVSDGKETFTLDQFVESGKLCSIYGHKFYIAKIRKKFRNTYKYHRIVQCYICGHEVSEPSDGNEYEFEQ